MGTIGISEQMQEILEEYEDDVDEVIDKTLKSTGRQIKAKLKEVSPEEYGDYAKGWQVKRTDDKGIVVYNSKYPGLTHLLSNGHAIVNGYGEYGRVNGDNHIQEAETEYVKKFEEELINNLNKN